jgi:ADP-ribose pyrophosphatase YjhB (NUDIX family)
MKRNDHCSYCGTRFTIDAWPRTCSQCKNVSYINPTPVAVLVVPTPNGVMAIRRTNGKLALPGGFIDFGESWQHACVREVQEETGLTLDEKTVSLFDVKSAPDGTLLVFGIVPFYKGNFDPFVATSETSERVFLRKFEPLTFSLHTEVFKKFLDGQMGMK